MKLVIVETPTKAKTITKFLGPDYKIESSFGHVRDLPKSKLGVDTENNFEPKYLVPDKARKNLNILKDLAKKADNIILATDEDREGEAIAWHLLEALDLPVELIESINLLPFMALRAGEAQDAILLATLVAIVASFLQVSLYWGRHRRFEKMHLVTFGLLLVFGGLTIALHDPVFIKWKPTVINWLSAAVFMGSHWIGEKPLVERMMSHAIQAPRPVWVRLSWMWIAFFIPAPTAVTSTRPRCFI